MDTITAGILSYLSVTPLTELEVPVWLVTIIGAVVMPMAVVLTKYLGRTDSREVTIERDGRQISRLTVKGRSISEERELLQLVFPELRNSRPSELNKDHYDLAATSELEEILANRDGAS